MGRDGSLGLGKTRDLAKSRSRSRWHLGLGFSTRDQCNFCIHFQFFLRKFFFFQKLEKKKFFLFLPNLPSICILSPLEAQNHCILCPIGQNDPKMDHFPTISILFDLVSVSVDGNWSRSFPVSVSVSVSLSTRDLPSLLEGCIFRI